MQSVRTTKKIIFPVHDLGVPIDNLTRDDIYGEPEFPNNIEKIATNSEKDFALFKRN